MKRYLIHVAAGLTVAAVVGVVRSELEMMAVRRALRRSTQRPPD